MNDRDSLEELFAILFAYTQGGKMPLANAAMLYVKEHLGKGYDIYYRRRLSVCRTLIDLHLTVEAKELDTLLAVTLSNHMPGDPIPPDMDDFFEKLYADQPEIKEILAILRQENYSDKAYYRELIKNPTALVIRLSERAVLLEKLYEWDPVDALKFVRETREDFFPMCIYAKEYCPEYMGAANILHEKMRNLCAVNDALLARFVETENAIRDEILSLKEENAVVRAMIADIKTYSQD